MASTPEELAKRIAEHFPESKVEVPESNRIHIDTPSSSLLQLSSYLRDSESFDHVTSVTGIDYPENDSMTVIYHLGAYANSTMRRLVLSISVNLPGQEAVIPSLTSVWPSAEYHERETHEMLGVVFRDHPNMNPLLLPEDWNDPPPLRKAFKLRGR